MIGLLTDRINNKLEKGNLINEHALNREPVPNKHHGRYSKSDHFCQQDDVECISTAECTFVNYAKEIYDFALNLFRKLLINKVC